jgi:hypothetical protein
VVPVTPVETAAEHRAVAPAVRSER